MKFLIASALELLGIGAVSFGFGMLTPWLGVVVAGVGLIVLGLALDWPGIERRER